MLNILILNWANADAVKDCILGLSRSDTRNFRIILINNFSGNEDLRKIESFVTDFSNMLKISLVENEKNLGYAGGNNAGIKFLFENNLQGNILILNPDVQVSPDTISEMQKALKEDVGVVSVRTLNPSGKILFDAFRLNGFFQKKIITNQPATPTDYSQGSCLLIKRDILSRTGLFDDRFFLYWEEVDFSLRVRKAGFKLTSINTSSVVRTENKEERQPDVFYYSLRNARLIMEKHPDKFSFAGYILYLIWTTIVGFKYIFKPKVFSRIIISCIDGLADSFRGRYYERRKK